MTHDITQLLRIAMHARRIVVLAILSPLVRPLVDELRGQHTLDGVDDEVADDGEKLPRVRGAAGGEVDAGDARVWCDEEVCGGGC